MRSEEYDRLTYRGSGLERLETARPHTTCLQLLERWWDDAVDDSRVSEPSAAALATFDPDTGTPDCRILLVKDFDRDGVRFFTNTASAKARQLEACQTAALTFLWHPMFRQVRIRGRVERTSRAEDLNYWVSRPRASQLASWASRQSRPVAAREILTTAFDDAEAELAPSPVPLPDRWGGYRLRPHQMEFWVGMPARLHDRVVWTRSSGEPGRLDTDAGWTCERLQP